MVFEKCMNVGSQQIVFGVPMGHMIVLYTGVIETTVRSGFCLLEHCVVRPHQQQVEHFYRRRIRLLVSLEVAFLTGCIVLVLLLLCCTHN